MVIGAQNPSQNRRHHPKILLVIPRNSKPWQLKSTNLTNRRQDPQRNRKMAPILKPFSTHMNPQMTNWTARRRLCELNCQSSTCAYQILNWTGTASCLEVYLISSNHPKAS